MASALGAQQQRAYFNRFAQRPEWSQIELDIASPAFKREVSAFLEIAGIPERSLILDFGCGRGLWSLALARLGHTVVPIDVSVTVHGVSWERAPGDWSCHARGNLG